MRGHKKTWLHQECIYGEEIIEPWNKVTMQLSALTSFYEWHSLKKNSISQFDQHSDLLLGRKMVKLHVSFSHNTWNPLQSIIKWS